MILYHATYRVNLTSIKKLGLGAKQVKNFEFSEDGVTYLTTDEEVAFSFCDSAEEVSDYKMNSGIIVLAIDTNKLDARYSGIDSNMRDDNKRVKYYTYSQNIKPELLKVVTRRKGIVGKLLSFKRVPSYE